MAKRTRKRPYKAHEFGQRLGEELATLGDGGYIKVVLPDGLSAHRIVGLTPTLEEDLLVRLEDSPCWRKRSKAVVPNANFWTPIAEYKGANAFVLTVFPNKVIGIAAYHMERDCWYVAGGAEVPTPTHVASLPELPQ